MKINLISAIIILLSTNVVIAQETSDAASEKGKNIGKVINAAIETVVPGIPQLLELFWPKNKDDNDKIKKEDLEKAIVASNDLLKKQIKTKMLSEITPLTEIGKELSIYNQFLEPSIPARKVLNDMKFLLAKEPDINKIDWVTLDIKWSTISDEIDIILGIEDKSIQSLSGLYGRTTLKKIKTNAGNLKVMITKRIAEKKKPLLIISRIDELNTTLASLDSTLGILLADLKDGFVGLEKTTNDEFVSAYKANLEGIPVLAKFSPQAFDEMTKEAKLMFAKYSDEALIESFILTPEGELPTNVKKVLSELKTEIEQ